MTRWAPPSRLLRVESNMPLPSVHFAHSRLLHTMLRVADLDRALAFYVGQLGMRLLRRACESLQRVGVRITRPPGPLRDLPDEWIAFVEDPDGYRIELIQRAAASAQVPTPVSP